MWRKDPFKRLVVELHEPCLLQVWRWAFFLGCILPIYWISHLVVHCLVVAVESTLFTTKQVLYYTYGVRVRGPSPRRPSPAE